MTVETSFEDIFGRLREILSFHGSDLNCIRDEPGDYHLDTWHIMDNKKPLFFGAVKINKNYVSFHLMPVYVFPELLNELKPDLKRRMQGKSCFNFVAADATLFSQLALLTEESFKRYQKAGYV